MGQDKYRHAGDVRPNFWRGFSKRGPALCSSLLSVRGLQWWLYPFFWNSTGVLAPEAVDGFIAIGQPHVADVLQRAMNMLGSPFRRDRAARWSALDTLRDEHDKQRDPAGRPRYKNIDSFRKLEREFYSLRASEAGGFENAADAYAGRVSE
jgi:hypothetical protein